MFNFIVVLASISDSSYSDCLKLLKSFFTLFFIAMRIATMFITWKFHYLKAFNISVKKFVSEKSVPRCRRRISFYVLIGFCYNFSVTAANSRRTDITFEKESDVTEASRDITETQLFFRELCLTMDGEDYVQV